MAKNPTTEMFATALEMRRNGEGWKAILAATGLNYSQAWLHCATEERREQGLLVEGEVTEAVVADLRAQNLSWGEIAVRCQMPESRVRKLYTEQTGFKSQGLRIGKGGRYYYGERGTPLYTEGLKPTGTAIPKGAHIAEAYEAADQQKLIHRPVAELVAKAEALGINPKSGKKNKTKAQLVKAIYTAQAKAAKAEAKAEATA